MEPYAEGIRYGCRGGLTFAPVNNIHHVHAIPRVAEDEAWLPYGVNEMDAQDGLIWVYGLGGDGAMAFTGFGIETITGIIDDL